MPTTPAAWPVHTQLDQLYDQLGHAAWPAHTRLDQFMTSSIFKLVKLALLDFKAGKWFMQARNHWWAKIRLCWIAESLAPSLARILSQQLNSLRYILNLGCISYLPSMHWETWVCMFKTAIYQHMLCQAGLGDQSNPEMNQTQPSFWDLTEQVLPVNYSARGVAHLECNSLIG